MSTSKNNLKMHTTEDIKFFFNSLRKASIIWSGRTEALRNSRKKFFVRVAKSGKKIYKYYWQCANCMEWFRNEAEVEVDHISEIGGVTEFMKNPDWNLVMQKMFPRPVKKHLQVLCAPCHLRKTKAFLCAAVKFKRIKK